MFGERTLRAYCGAWLLLTGVCLMGETLSEQRLALGHGEAVKLLEGSVGVTRATVLDAVRRVLVKRFPELGRRPSAALITEVDSLRDYERKFEAILEERHPELDDAALRRVAERRYPLYHVGDQVTLYHVRGNKVERVSGRIVTIEDGMVMVGAQRVFVSDMERVQDNGAEVLKFRPEETRQARERYVAMLREQNLRDRETFRRTQHSAVERELLARDRARNERNGYTLVERRWLVPEELFGAIVTAAANEVSERRYEALNATMVHRREPLDAQLSTLDLRYDHEKPGQLENPALKRIREEEERRDRAIHERAEQLRAAELREREEKARRAAEAHEKLRLAAEQAKREAAEAKRLAAEKAKRAREEALAAEKERERQAAEERLVAEEKSRLAEAEAKRRAEAEAERLAMERSHLIFGVLPLPLALGMGMALVVIVGVVVVIYRRRQEKDRFSKFFEGKGKLQKDFWSQASADPEHFKYVAYMFPSLDEATKALGHLTYIKPGPGGDLRCTRDLQYGVYPHLDGAVCFIGGTKFSYALWREASAVLPELPHAQYFKVSTEPEVQLVIPNLSQMKMQVESLGIEDVQNESGEFLRLYKYRAASREEAEKFLEQFDINEVGIIVHVETPDGILGKDENGVFTLED